MTLADSAVPVTGVSHGIGQALVEEALRREALKERGAKRVSLDLNRKVDNPQ